MSYCSRISMRGSRVSFLLCTQHPMKLYTVASSLINELLGIQERQKMVKWWIISRVDGVGFHKWFNIRVLMR